MKETHEIGYYHVISVVGKRAIKEKKARIEAGDAFFSPRHRVAQRLRHLCLYNLPDSRPSAFDHDEESDETD